MRAYIFLLISSIAILFGACNSGNNTAPAKPLDANVSLVTASWLLGDWQNISDDGSMKESWVRQSDSLFTGVSYFIEGADTVSAESIELKHTTAGIEYIPTVGDQNEGKPVSFKLTVADQNHLVFENPEHDFPSKISYTRITPDSLVAEISGKMLGINNSEQFPMSRVK